MKSHATGESCHCAGALQTDQTEEVRDPKRWFNKGNPLISGKSGLVKYYNLTRWMVKIMEKPIKIG